MRPQLRRGHGSMLRSRRSGRWRHLRVALRLYQSQAFHSLFERVFHRVPVLDSFVVHVESLMHPVLHLLARQRFQSWRHHNAGQHRLG
ncbi:hypothetical protein FuraDRAFT_1955 [Pseudogulbenkiania ferrooxidans 2002]|uniref:Uncharacterized protein n=1 Tax=Pseudogulbenkiania ferrooxidans 2002 TaxID=279714 RepID=B9Z3M0_9NEIS|nr:hypothetical protein FuraDRAFT_1955 [Pseudogulbenkiania ferrooxidans 2002]